MALTKIDDRGLNTPIDLLDNEKIRFGTGNDLEIFHDGSHTYLNNNTGNLNISGALVGFANVGNSEWTVKSVSNGAVELYYNGVKKLETTSTGATITSSANGDGINILSGNTSSTIYIDANRSSADSGLGQICGRWNGTTVAQISFKGGSDTTNKDDGCIWFGTESAASNGNVNATERLRITSGGDVSIQNDSGKFTCGTGDDLQIYHNGSASYIKSPSHTLFIQATTIDIGNGAGNEAKAKFIDDGGVELYYDNTKKFETTADGCKMPDNERIAFGAGDDLRLYHDSSNSYIWNTTGDLQIRSNSLYLCSISGEGYLLGTSNGSTDLFYDNSKKFETTSSGITVLGPEGGAGEVAIYADEGDDNADKWKLQMDGSNVFRIQNYASGSWENAIAAVGDGPVELFHDNSRKLRTTSGGITVTGAVSTDDINLSNLTAPLANEVDGTRGSWTMQEGADDLFLINRVNGKKYKFNLTEVS